MLYSFNNDIRFNSQGEFNLPCGKTDFNKANYEKLKFFVNSKPGRKFYFICGDFREAKIKKIIMKSDVVYADPPYIITNAFYNENNGWNSKDEEDLLNLLLTRVEKNKFTLLSNITEKTGHKNKILINWINNNPSLFFENIDYHYKSSSYNKINRNSNEKEVLVFGGEY